MTSRFRSGTKKGRLLYYYFFTVYNNTDWGQTMSISVQTDGSSTSETSIDKVTVANVDENKWYLRTVSFDLPTTDFTVSNFWIEKIELITPIWSSLDIDQVCCSKSKFK